MTTSPPMALRVLSSLRKADQEGALAEVAKATKIPLYGLRDLIKTSDVDSEGFLKRSQLLKLDNYFNKRGNDHVDHHKASKRSD
jgi:hypothetical protein